MSTWTRSECQAQTHRVGCKVPPASLGSRRLLKNTLKPKNRCTFSFELSILKEDFMTKSGLSLYSEETLSPQTFSPET